MIIVSMGNGLGNQMFEYAFAYKLGLLFPNQTIKFDVNYAFENAHNGIEIDKIFGIKLDVASLEEVESLTDRKIIGIKDSLLKKVLREIRKRCGFTKESFLRQNDFTKYYPEFFEINPEKSYYFFGPFCNVKYFEDIKEHIITLYKFPQLNDANKKWEKKIKEEYCVSIHIRRGDYLKEKLNVLDLNYYKRAIDVLVSKDIDHKFCFLIFTDDVDWVKKEFGWLNNSYIVEDNKGTNNFRDMQLMSMCKHNINSNSTFSFWGAYLNTNPDKIVIAPKEPLKYSNYPFYAEDWILI